MEVYLVRHAKPRIENGEFYRAPLSNEGVEATQEFLKKIPRPDAIYSSPYVRAQQTAEIIAKHFSLQVKVLDEFREWDLQSLNLQEEYAAEEERGWKNQSLVVKGGESLQEVRERFLKGIAQLSGEEVLVVTHGTAIDLFCASLAGREAIINDIKRMNYLDYAIIQATNQQMHLVKDII